ncbi:MAG: multicomponent Na+:H+ antiporter subunit [Thermosediminibacterales bacterium]|nr:multicomponent Na+:H+ antiporter subunit [Thermosediminibacterales bacterium]MDK2836257.1 multicomponent Na+:H+ antiporter subunit [Thermosediminibacterales bacterium]
MNSLILKTVATPVLYLIVSFSVYVFFRGHNNPGGGFIAGLLTAGAFVLQYLSFDSKTVKSNFSLNWKKLIPVGLILALGSGLGGMILGYPFLSHSFGCFYLPLIGELELATAIIFDLGVYFVVLGTALTIISVIGGKD